jgi:hypothetical protein
MDASEPAAPPDPADAWVSLVQALADMADAADAEALAHAKADFERAKTAWSHGWSRGVTGLLADAEADAAALKPSAPG